MNFTTREVTAPESYATFWEPIVIDSPRPPAPAGDTSDAYQDFVNSTEDTPVSLQVQQIDI
ncbi:MAG TPA: hypothetical protein VGE74_22950 [Gemmata sp.]